MLPPLGLPVLASMEPPCEHGGVLHLRFIHVRSLALQWSRRVNTAECCSALARQSSGSSSFNGAAV